MDILKQSMALSEHIVALRRHLHETPELSGCEFHTVAFICAELDKLGLDYVNIPNGGVLAHLDGNAPGKTVLLRADCDALPIDESAHNAKGPKTCVSKVPGVHHACGHDAHVAMLLSAAKILSENKEFVKGRIYFLFERGEEKGSHIYWVLKYIQETGIHIDAAFAAHADTTLYAGQLACQGGPANAGYVGYTVSLTGRGGHGSRPDRTVNPIDCFVSIYECVKSIRMNHIRPDMLLTNSIGMVQAGEAGNIVPESLRFRGTCRFYDAAAGTIFREKLAAICKAQAELFGCSINFESLSGPALPLVNNQKLAEVAGTALRRLLGDDALWPKGLNMGAETFACTAAYYPAVMLRVGIRNEEKGITIGAHNPGYDIDEAGLPYGTAAYITAALAFLDYEGEIPFDGNEELRSKSVDELWAYTNLKIPPQYDSNDL